MGVDVPVWFIIRGYSQSSQMPSEAGHENRVGTLSGGKAVRRRHPRFLTETYR